MFVPAVVLIVGGVLLLLVEGLLPGFTLPGLLGLSSMVAGIIWAGVHFGSFATAGLYGLVTVAVAVPVGLLGLWLAPRTGLGRRVILQTSEQSEEGFQAPSAHLEQLVGMEGVALTPLRPAGSVLIQGRPVDVVTEGQFIERGTTVKVIMVEGNRVVVSSQDSTVPNV